MNGNDARSVSLAFLRDAIKLVRDKTYSTALPLAACGLGLSSLNCVIAMVPSMIRVGVSRHREEKLWRTGASQKWQGRGETAGPVLHARTVLLAHTPVIIAAASMAIIGQGSAWLHAVAILAGNSICSNTA